MTNLLQEIVCASDYEIYAKQKLDPSIYAFVSSGAGHEYTTNANHKAFEEITLYNRILSDASHVTTSVSLFEETYHHPVFLAPLAYQMLFHPDGEKASAQGAEATDSCMVLSTLSSVSLEKVATLAGPKWFQLYFQAHKDDTLNLLHRAEKAGYQALVVTVDTPAIMMGAAAIRAGFQMPSHINAANLEHFSAPEKPSPNPPQSTTLQDLMAHAPTWDDLEWLISASSLPVLVKGISHPDDAQKAIEYGADGIIVSTHGGRSLEGLPGALHLLAAIREQLGPQCPVLFDSGIRSGNDVFKAIALGADAVLIGRLQAYAISVGGALGVAHMLKLLREELEFTMALAGCASLDQIDRSTIFNAGK